MLVLREPSNWGIWLSIRELEHASLNSPVAMQSQTGLSKHCLGLVSHSLVVAYPAASHLAQPIQGVKCCWQCPAAAAAVMKAPWTVRCPGVEAAKLAIHTSWASRTGHNFVGSASRHADSHAPNHRSVVVSTCMFINAEPSLCMCLSS